MRKHSDEIPDWEDQRKKIIGLGETSIRKSYYPELRQRIQELEKKNRELEQAYAEQSAAEEELRQQFEVTSNKERDLQVNEERLVMSQEIGHLGSWEFSLETGLIWGSAEALRIYGFTPAAGYHALADVEACIVEQDRDRVRQAFIDFLEGRRTYDIEIPINPRDGSPARVVHSRARIERNPEGRPVRVIGVLQDITERKRAELELKESEARFRNLIQASPVPIILARQGKFVYANPAFCRMTGYREPEEIIGRDLLDFIAPEFREKVAEYIRARNHGEPAEVHYESVGIRHDGSHFPYEITVAVISLPEGPTTMAFITDISARKDAEAALLKGRERLRRAELVAGLGHWEFNVETQRVYASDGARSLYGMYGETWTIPEVQAIPLPEYRPLLDEALRALIMENRPYDVEFRIRRPDDQKILDVHSIAEYDPSARVVFGVIQDITERRQNEEALRTNEKKFRDIVETSPDIVWEVDLHGNFTYLSPRIFELLGYRAEELIGKPFLSLLIPEQIPLVTEVFKKHIAGTELRPTIDVVARHANGQLRDMEVRSVSETDAEGNLTGFRGITRDITDRKYQERTLKGQLNLGIALQNSRGLPETLDACLSAAIEISSMDSGGIYLVDKQDGSLTLEVAKNLGEEFLKNIARFPADSERVKIVMRKEPVYTQYSQTGIIHTPAHEREGLRAIAILPVTAGGRVVASLNVASHTRDDIAAGARIALETISSQIGTAIDQKMAEDALQVSEERYRSLVNITDTGYVMLDNQGRVIDANEVYVRLTGRADLSDIVGHPVTEWTAPYDLERNEREVEQCFRTGVVHGLEIDYLQPDGTIKPIEINATLFRTGDRDIILTLCRDISDRKRINVALQQARNKLNLLNAVTFQDIQTAAFSLSAYQELVKTVIADPRAMSYIEKQELFLKKMIETLDFAKNYQEMGMHPPRWQNVRQVFLYAISHLDFLKMKQNLLLDNLEVFADPLFEKALFNIMENVLEHGVSATEVSLRYEEKKDFLMLIIEDNGVGIPPEEKNMIFDRGYGKGSGLGLFLVREVLSITGMTIRETGMKGKGTRFEVMVPHGVYRITGKALQSGPVNGPQ